MQASLSSVLIGENPRYLGYEIGKGGDSEQELGPADPKDSKATPFSHTSGDEQGESGVSFQLPFDLFTANCLKFTQ